jgi:hypothetical protein
LRGRFTIPEASHCVIDKITGCCLGALLASFSSIAPAHVPAFIKQSARSLPQRLRAISQDWLARSRTRHFKKELDNYTF